MVFVQYRNIVNKKPKKFMTKARTIQCHNNVSKLSFISIQCVTHARLTHFYLITKQKHIGTLHKSGECRNENPRRGLQHKIRHHLLSAKRKHANESFTTIYVWMYSCFWVRIFMFKYMLNIYIYTGCPKTNGISDFQVINGYKSTFYSFNFENRHFLRICRIRAL